MKSTTKLALVAAAGLAVYVAARSIGGDSSANAEDPSMISGRAWLERKPEKPQEYVHGAYLLNRPKLGLFQRSSAYDFHFERFDYKRDKSKLELSFPQSGKKAEVTFTITKCDSLPPFDLCLDLSDNPWGGPKRYYGMQHPNDASVEQATKEMEAESELP